MVSQQGLMLFSCLLPYLSIVEHISRIMINDFSFCYSVRIMITGPPLTRRWDDLCQKAARAVSMIELTRLKSRLCPLQSKIDCGLDLAIPETPIPAPGCACGI